MRVQLEGLLRGLREVRMLPQNVNTHSFSPQLRVRDEDDCFAQDNLRDMTHLRDSEIPTVSGAP